MKRLYRSRKDKIIAGVCGGLGEYFNTDPVIIRILAVFLVFWGGGGLIAYVIAMIIIPTEPSGSQDTETVAEATPETDTVEPDREPAGDTGALIVGVVLVVVGGIFMLKNFPFFDNYFWWFRHHIGHLFWPAAIIAVGAFMVFRGSRK